MHYRISNVGCCVLEEHDFINLFWCMLAFVHYPHASQWHTKQKPHGEAVAHTTSGLGPVSALRCNNRSVNLTSSPDTSTSITLNISLQVWGEVARWVQSATQAKSAEWSAPRHSVTRSMALSKPLCHFFPPTRTHEPRKPQSLGRSYLKVIRTQAHDVLVLWPGSQEVRAQPIFHFPPHKTTVGQ